MFNFYPLDLDPDPNGALKNSFKVIQDNQGITGTLTTLPIQGTRSPASVRVFVMALVILGSAVGKNSYKTNRDLSGTVPVCYKISIKIEGLYGKPNNYYYKKYRVPSKYHTLFFKWSIKSFLSHRIPAVHGLVFNFPQK